MEKKLFTIEWLSKKDPHLDCYFEWSMVGYEQKHGRIKFRAFIQADSSEEAKEIVKYAYFCWEKISWCKIDGLWLEMER